MAVRVLNQVMDPKTLLLACCRCAKEFNHEYDLSICSVWTRADPRFQGPLNVGGSNGGVSRSGLVLPFWSFFGLFGTFPFFGIFPICPGTLWGFSRFVLFLFLGLLILLKKPTRNSPERVRDTIWTFPEKSGKPPGLETPRFSQQVLNVGA